VRGVADGGTFDLPLALRATGVVWLWPAVASGLFFFLVLLFGPSEPGSGPDPRRLPFQADQPTAQHPSAGGPQTNGPGPGGAAPARWTQAGRQAKPDPGCADSAGIGGSAGDCPPGQPPTSP
jgi:hypothetical protein